MIASRTQQWLGRASVALLASTLVYTYQVPNANGFQVEELARILFFHLPCALVASVLILASAVWAYRSLSKPDPKFDHRLLASWEIATVLAVLTLTTGIVFSRVQWGAFWNWDPRQTSYLFVTLLLLGGLALRAGLEDEKKRATAFAAYALLMQVPILFLTFVFPRLPQTTSLHPSNTIASGGLDASYRLGVYLGFFAVLAAAWWLWRMRVFAAELEWQGSHEDGELAMDRSDSAHDGHRGPVVVPIHRDEADS